MWVCQKVKSVVIPQEQTTLFCETGFLTVLEPFSSSRPAGGRAARVGLFLPPNPCWWCVRGWYEYGFTRVNVWRSEDNFQVLVFSFHDVDPSDGSQVLMQMTEPVEPFHQPLQLPFYRPFLLPWALAIKTHLL